MSQSETTSRWKKRFVQVVSFLFISLGLLYSFWESRPEQIEKREQESRERLDLKTDERFTGQPVLSSARREEDGTFTLLHHPRIHAHNGIKKVQIKDLDGRLVWEKSMDDVNPKNVQRNEADAKQVGPYRDIYLSVPRLPDGNYLITVYDDLGNVYTKQARFK